MKILGQQNKYYKMFLTPSDIFSFWSDTILMGWSEERWMNTRIDVWKFIICVMICASNDDNYIRNDTNHTN